MLETIQIYVSIDNAEEIKASIPCNIDEVELKKQLRDLGYISSYRNSYVSTKVYHLISGEKIEICTDKYRSLEDLSIQEGSHILIKSGVPEPVPIQYSYPTYKSYYYPRGSYGRFNSGGGGKVLYGCPMAQSVTEAIVEAEQYSEEDSSVSTGFIDSTC